MSDRADRFPPFGSFAPSRFQARLMALGQRMPPTWAGRRGASLIRSVLKRWSDRPVDAVRLGSRMRLHPRGNASEKRLMTSPQFFDPVELAVLEGALTPGFVFIDIGANAGAYTLFVAQRVGAGGRIVAVEPHPTARARLLCNLALNGIGWVSVAAVALAEEAGTSLLFVNDRNIGSSSLDGAREPGIEKRHLQVPCQTLLGLVAQEGLERIDAVKIDVEGAEDRVLVAFFSAAPSALWPRLLLIEDNRGAWQQDLPGTLERCGYLSVAATRGNLVMRRQAPRAETEQHSGR
jgi:FkbM family methyltransferase